ncbi:hypothetical protein A3Q34_03500 [Colwellia sp. PAMC 20917]|uniref:hypothetical protein n=1 Tax=Colwellia sp. PAMC 20917 TaxID=1816218 RepID=UPI000878B592|nr:hypothetical protein [Colwellia sp. PAMC 20917]AOW76003.1 hypothetical protein A3Q34_03500 [Colwellia sp. PAMC 20917]
MATLDCPSCDKKIEVTWKRYWQSASGYYRCPSCAKLSKIRTKPSFVRYCSWVLQLAPLALFIFIIKTGVWSIVVLGFYFIVFWIDKLLDERFGYLERAPEPRRKKVLLIFLLLVFLVYKFFQYHDDPLEPVAQLWIEQYSEQNKLENNVFIQLIGMQNTSNSDADARGRELYLNSLAKIKKGKVGQKLKYPNIVGFDALDDEPLLCELKDIDCVNYLKLNLSQAKELVDSFSLVINGYLKLEKLTNFSFLNSISTEPDFNQLMTLNKLLALSIAIDIHENKLDEAAVKLVQKITIDRAFMSNSNDILFTVLPVVNFENHYLYLLVNLVRGDYHNTEYLESVLTPLTGKEISMNDSWKAKFVDYATPMKFENIAGDAIAQNGFWIKLNARMKYKENMTINDLFKYFQTQIIPDNFKKNSLISLIKDMDDKANVHYDAYASDNDNLYLYLIKNYRNPVGALMAATARPKFLNMYGSVMEMDINMLLANILIKSHHGSVEDILTDKGFVEPYSNTAPSYGEHGVCYTVNKKEICMNIN